MDGDRSSFFLLGEEPGSRLLLKETFAGTAAPRSPLSAPLFPSDIIPACVHHGYASPEANVCSDQMLSQRGPGAKQRLSHGQGQRSFPIPTSCHLS